MALPEYFSAALSLLNLLELFSVGQQQIASAAHWFLTFIQCSRDNEKKVRQVCFAFMSRIFSIVLVSKNPTVYF